MKGRAVLLLPLASMAAVSLARAPGFGDWQAAQESLRHLPPNMRFWEMHRLGLIDRSPVAPATDSGGVRLVGKWGGGPSVKVTGRDSIVYLSRGSEVVAISFADTTNPEVLSYMQVNGLVSRSVLVGDRLYVGSTGGGPRYIDVFDVADPAHPVRLGSVQTQLNDIAVLDTLVYAIGDDSLKVFSFADPENPWLVGACRDSGTSISVANGYAYLGDRWGLYIVDVRTPAAPQRVASWGSYVVSISTRNNICCATTGNPNRPDELNFSILDVTVPGMPIRIGYLADAGGTDMYLEDTFAYLSGYYAGPHEFRILNISDSTNPTHVGAVRTPDDRWGVWANPARGRAYVADRLPGLFVADISDPHNPVMDTILLGAGYALDVSVGDGYAYVAEDGFGMTILDVSSPGCPVEVGSIDSTRNMVTHAVLLDDSFAYMGWAPNRPWLRSVDVSDPSNPTMAGGVSTFDFPQDMVQRDSLLYVAQAYRFQVVNVARPREPVLVGSCNLSGDVWDMDVEDTIAYITSNALTMVNIARADSPRVVSTWRTLVGVDVEDTIGYACGGDAVRSFSVARPSQPYILDSVSIAGWESDIVVSDSLAFAGGQVLYIIDKRNPRDLRVIGQRTPPHEFRRLLWEPSYLYAACYDAGVCILELLPTGVAERSESETARKPQTPTLVRGMLELPGKADAELLDICGRRVMDLRPGANDIRHLAPGVYFVREEGPRGQGSQGSSVRKVVLQK